MVVGPVVLTLSRERLSTLAIIITLVIRPTRELQGKTGMGVRLSPTAVGCVAIA